MNKAGKYDTSGLTETQFEPGSRRRVLKNLLGVRGKREMDQVEAKAHLHAIEELTRKYDSDHRFIAKDICMMHRVWLGSIYEWAGEYRRVNLSKGSFPFAAAEQIPKLMTGFEKGPLREFTPCCFRSTDEIVCAIAAVHTELILIHPFRDGNGRVSRMLAVLMALQAGLPPLDFGGITGRKRQEYFLAIRAGLDKNYEPMENVFTAVIRRTVHVQK